MQPTMYIYRVTSYSTKVAHIYACMQLANSTCLRNKFNNYTFIHKLDMSKLVAGTQESLSCYISSLACLSLLYVTDASNQNGCCYIDKNGPVVTPDSRPPGTRLCMYYDVG